MLNDCVTTLRDLDREMAALYEAESGSEAEDLAEKECKKAFDYLDKANNCRSMALAWLEETSRSRVKSSLSSLCSALTVTYIDVSCFLGMF